MQAVPSTELHCLLEGSQRCSSTQQTGPCLHIPMGGVVVVVPNSLPREGAAPSELGRGLSARPHQACMSMLYADTIRSTCRVTTCVSGARQNLWPKQSPSSSFANLLDGSVTPSPTFFVTPSPTFFSLNAICCGCRHPWPDHSLACCCSRCTCSSYSCHHQQQPEDKVQASFQKGCSEIQPASPCQGDKNSLSIPMHHANEQLNLGAASGMSTCPRSWSRNTNTSKVCEEALPDLWQRVCLVKKERGKHLTKLGLVQGPSPVGGPGTSTQTISRSHLWDL